MKNLRLLLFFLSLLVSQVQAQNATVKGDVTFHINDSSSILPKERYAYLKSENYQDSTSLDANNRFAFTQLSAGRYSLSFSVQNYPYDKIYNFYIEDSEDLYYMIKIVADCPFRKKDKVCPICKTDDQVIPIVYGLTSRDFITTDENGKPDDREETHPGGCVVNDCQPVWYCKRDKEEF